MNYQNKTLKISSFSSSKVIRTSSLVFIAAALIVGGFFAPNLALAAATVTPAGGGTNISIDTTSVGATPSFTLLSGPTITETAPGDISAGTHTITLPAGWKFDTSQVVKVNGGAFIPTTQDAVITDTTLSFTITGISSSPGVLSFISDLSGNSIKVMPTGTESGISGDMTHSGAVIAGVTDGSTPFGTLSTVAGTVTQLAFTEQPVNTEYGSVLSPSLVVETQDQFGNHSTSGLGENLDVTLAVTLGDGVLQGTATIDIGANGGVAIYTDLYVDTVGAGKQLTASATGLTSAVSNSFEVTQKTLTATVTADDKIYNGDNIAIVTATDISDGLVYGDVVTADIGISATFSDENAGTGKTVTAAGIILSGDKKINYSFSGEGTGTADINPLPIIVTPTAGQTKIYGNDDLTFTYDFAPDLIGADTFISVLGRVVGENVGTYAYTLGDLSAGGNYTLALVPETFEITARTLNVTATGVDKVYDANTTAEVILLDDRVDGDNVTLGYTAAFTDEDVGNGKSVSISNISITGGVDGGNYSLGSVPTNTTADITAKELTVDNSIVTSKTYDGTKVAVITGATLVGVIGDDTVEIATHEFGTFDTKNVGTNKSVAMAITITGADGGNYTVTQPILTGNIAKKEVTLTAIANEKIYDGGMMAVATPELTGELAPDDNGVYIETYGDKNVGTSKTLTPAVVSIVDDASADMTGNYNVTLTSADLGTITHALLTATVTVENKVVDGSDSATITGRTLISVVSGDDVTAEGGTAIFAGVTVGTHDVSAAGITITGADASNYSYDGPAAGTGNILPVPTVVYVDGSWAGTTAWEDPDGAGPATYYGYDAFADIQEAIGAVEVSGTVNVAAGTYVESLTVDKTLSIIGVGDTAILAPVQDSDGIAIAANNVLIQDLKIVTSSSGADSNMAIKIEGTDSVTISGTIIETTGNKALGIWIGTSASTNLNIVDNIITINGKSTGIYTGNVNPAHSTWTISGNTISAPNAGVNLELYDVNNVTVSGNTFGVSGSVSLTYSSEISDVSGLVLQNNIFNGNGDIAGVTPTVWIESGFTAGDGLTTVSGITITGNTFNDWVNTAIKIGEVDSSSPYSKVSGVTINQNKFLKTNPASILESYISESVNAENNYWGTAVLATIDTKTTGMIDHDPYWVNVGKTILSSTAVDAVYVDDNYSDGNSGLHYFGYDAFATIQEGVDAVATAGTITVTAGTYDEQVLIDKSLTLQGAGDTTIIQPPAVELTVTSNIPWIGGGSSTMSTIVSVETTGGTVTVKNLKIDGSLIPSKSTTWLAGLVYLETSGTIDSVTVIGNPDMADRTAGIFAAATTNPVTLEVTGCTVEVYTRAGIYALGGTMTADYHHNEINGPGDSSAGVPNGMFFLEGAKGSATYNTVTDLSYTGDPIYKSTGIGTYNAGTGIVFSNNEIFYVQNAFALSTGTSGTTVEYNDVHDSHTGVKLEAGVTNSIIQYNDIYDNDFAIRGDDDMGDGNVVHFNNFTGNMGAEEIVSGSTYIGAISNIHATYILNTTNNWWGHQDGPQHFTNPGADESADSVSDNVLFRPWCTESTCTVEDNDSPTVEISSIETSPTNASPIPITITFSENVTDLIADEIIVTNGSKGSLVGSGSDYSIDVTPVGDEEVAVNVAGSVAWDLAGNYNIAATTEFSITFDSAVPELTSVSIASNNFDTTLAMVGDVVTLLFTSDEAIDTPIVTIAENSTVVSGGPTDWTATYTMAGGDTEGLVAFAIDFADLAGNNGATVITVDDASSVTFDKTAPTVTLTSIAGDGYINDSEKAAIHVIGTAEADSTVNVSLTGGATVSGSGTATGGDYDITIDGTTLTDGTITPSVTATDATGNVSTAIVIPVAVKDIVAPTVVSHTPGVNAVNVESGAVTITFSDNMNVDQGDITFGPEATYAIGGNGTNVITLTPDSILDSNTVYTMTVTTTATDEVGNAVVGYDWQFTTATLYDIALNASSGGWNLISLPVVPNVMNISTVLGDAESDIQVVWAYDPTHPNADPDTGWLVYTPGNPEGTNNLDNITAGYGYWISVTSNTNISGSGSLLSVGPILPPSRSLSAGWNLVGYYQIPGEAESNSAKAFSSLGDSYTSLWGFNNSTGQFKSTVDPILPGDAFWVSLPSVKVYTPSNL